MRRLVLRFQRLLRHGEVSSLDRWLDDAVHSGIPAISAFARTLRIDTLAVRNAVSERWSNGQTKGQINRLRC